MASRSYAWDSDERRAEHLRDHLTDGRWHDDCIYCGERRVHGGTGTEAETASMGK